MRAFTVTLILSALAGLAPAQAEQGAQAAAGAQDPEQAVIFKPFDKTQFFAECRQLGATDAQLATFDSESVDYGLARAADRLLRRVVPAFDAAVVLQENVDPKAALELTKLLAGSDSLLLAAHVRYHLGELFLDADDPELAAQVLSDYVHLDANHSPLDGEAVYYYAQALAEIPYPDLAIMHFRAFLQWFPDASERFRAAAHQQILVLERQRESQLHDLADRMKRTRRDLHKKKTNEPIQIEQEKYVDELQQLIELFEEREKQAGGKASGNGPSSNPANQSALPQGDGSVGDVNNRPTLADRWGPMKDRDREKIQAEVQNGLPPQYRKMLMQFYRKLGSDPGQR